MCNCNQQTTTSKPCAYTGADLPTLGINTGDSIEEAIQAIEEYVSNITIEAPNCNELVKYTETADPAIGNNVFTVIPNTIYTVPQGYGGVFELNYVGQALFAQPGSVELYIDKNNNQISLGRKIQSSETAVGDNILQINLFVSKILLDEGDVIKIKGQSTDLQNCYLQNCILKITRL